MSVVCSRTFPHSKVSTLKSALYDIKQQRKLRNSIHILLLGRNWNIAREMSDREQLLSMRFTTNAEAAKGKLH